MGVTQEVLRPLLLTAILPEPVIAPQSTPHPGQQCTSAPVPTMHLLGTHYVPGAGLGPVVCRRTAREPSTKEGQLCEWPPEAGSSSGLFHRAEVKKDLGSSGDGGVKSHCPSTSV